MSIDLDAIKARLSAATSGPWWTDETAEMDAVLIAHAPGDIAALVAEVERLGGDADLLRTGLDATRAYADRVEREVERLRQACIAYIATISTIDYACGEPNEMRCSDFDVHGNEEAVVERVRTLVAVAAQRQERITQLEKERDDWVDASHMHKKAANDLAHVVTTVQIALSPTGGYEGWRPPRDIDPLVDLALDVREAKEKAEDKAIRLDLDGAGIEVREREAVELVDLRAEVARLKARAEKAEANYAFMVEHAANEKLDGYRELGARAAAAENEADGLRAEAHLLRERLRETAQILVAEVGADGPMNAEDAARKAVEQLQALRDERPDVLALIQRVMASAPVADKPEEKQFIGGITQLLATLANVIERGAHRHEVKP